MVIHPSRIRDVDVVGQAAEALEEQACHVQGASSGNRLTTGNLCLQFSKTHTL